MATVKIYPTSDFVVGMSISGMGEENSSHAGMDDIYAGGDCVRSKGEASTVMAVEDGKIAARAIHSALSGKDASELVVAAKSAI